MLAISAHTLADGGLPDVPLAVLITVLIGWTATAAAGKATGTAATVAVLGVGQMLMHLVLSTLMVHPAHETGAALSGDAMLATHTCATIVTALLVAHADAMLLTAARAMRLLLPAIPWTLPVPAASAPPVVGSRADAEGLADLLLRHSHRKRGPPIYS